MSEWSHLPNARHIDRIFKDVKGRPQVWQRIRLDTAILFGADARNKAWDAAWRHPAGGVGDTLAWRWIGPWNEIRNRSRDSKWSPAYEAASDPVLALCRWDEAGDLVELPPSALRLLISCDNPSALLMYSASLAFHTDSV